MELFVDWKNLQFGDSVDLVLKVLVAGSNKLWCSTVNLPSRNLVLMGDFNPPAIGSMVTLISGKVVDLQEPIKIEVGASSSLFPLTACGESSLGQVVELCSGAGFFSSVAKELGLSVVVGVDQNPRWRSLFLSLHEDSTFVNGTCGDPTLVSRLFGLGAAHSILIAGVSCQPHSVGGDARGFQDPRALCLPAVLRTTWLLQCPVTILECVPGVLKDRDFQGLLRAFCQSTGAVLSQSVLQLANSWCSFRERWFGILTAPCFGEIKIPSMPFCENFQKVRQVMPSLIQMSSRDFEQIHLTLYELSKFYSFAHGGIESHFLQGDMTLPTALHSAANQLYPCRCGCRRPFTLERLQARGLFGTLVPLNSQIRHENQMLQDCRYLHPSEMLLLNGGLVGFDAGDDLRLTISAIGQAVSPLQGLWVLSHVAQRVQTFLGIHPISPVECFDRYVAKILAARDHLWGSSLPVPLPTPACQHDVEMVDDIENQTLKFRVGATSTVGQFQQCHHEFTGRHSSSLHVFCGDVLLGPSDFLVGKAHLHFGFFPEVSNENEESPLPCPCAELPSFSDSIVVSPTAPFTVVEHPFEVDTNPSPDAIAQLSAQELIGLMQPHAQSLEAVQALLSQQISKVTRCSILDNQLGSWADDELRFFLQQQVVHFSDQAVVMWDPLILSNAVRFGAFEAVKSLASSLISPSLVITAVLVDAHWYPIVWRWCDSELLAFTCGHAFGRSLAVSKIHQVVSEALECDCHPVQFQMLDFAVNDFCGAMAIAFCDFCLSGERNPLRADIGPPLVSW